MQTPFKQDTEKHGGPPPQNKTDRKSLRGIEV
jgi:hypothetical protein